MYVAAMIRGQTIARNYANPVAVARCLEKKEKRKREKRKKGERKWRERERERKRERRERARSFYCGYAEETGQRGKNTLGQEEKEKERERERESRRLRDQERNCGSAYRLSTGSH